MTGVGVAGWSYPDWEGRVYPRPKGKGFHGLAYLARYVDLMEVNSTFYAPPDPGHVARWTSLVADLPQFQFVMKLHRSFTHGPLQGPSELQSAAAEFKAGIRPAQEAGRLLALLVQFPVSLREGPEGWARVARIREAFPDEALCLEFRHASWFTPEALSRLARLKVGLVHIDLPAAHDHPPEDHPTLGPLAYLRLHGRNARTWFDRDAERDEKYDYRYGASELDDVARRVARIAAEADRSIVVTNNHFAGQAVANALELKFLLTGMKPKAPEPLLDTYPDLVRITERDGQGRLF